MGGDNVIKKDIVGKKFGRLTVLDEYKKVKNGTEWKCKCDCGNVTFVYRGKLTTGQKKSCGCLNKSLNGLSKHKLYSIYHNIKDRCYNSNCHAYNNYGGRGIKMCDEWLDGFLTFYNWAIDNGYQEGLSIDRIDNDGDYTPENCQWIALGENVGKANKHNHRRKTKYKYYAISPNGEKYVFTNASEFSRKHKLNDGDVRVAANGGRNPDGWTFGFTNQLNN